MRNNPSTVPSWRLAVYGLPGLPLAAVTLPVYVHVPTFYAVDLGLGFATVGAILLAARIWDAVSDPLIGFLSDRTTGRFGKRKPWIVAGSVLTALMAYLLFAPPDGVQGPFLLTVTVLLYLGWTMAVLPYNAWGAELSDDYHRRSTITAWREGAVLAGTLLAVALPFAVGDDSADGLASLGLALLVLLPLAAAAAVTWVPKTDEADTPLKPTVKQVGGIIARNRPFRRLLAAWFLNGIANGLPATLFLLFIGTVLDASDHSGALLFTYFLSAVAGLPLWLALSRKLGKHRCWCLAMAWACVWFAGALFLGPGDVAAFFVICIATGLALGADLALPPSLQADVIDLDRAAGRERNTGAYFALWSMAQKLALALAVGLAFPVLEWAGFQADPLSVAGENIVETASPWVLAFLYAGVPIALKVAAMSVIWGHPITAAEHAELSSRISRKE